MQKDLESLSLAKVPIKFKQPLTISWYLPITYYLKPITPHYRRLATAYHLQTIIFFMKTYNLRPNTYNPLSSWQT